MKKCLACNTERDLSDGNDPESCPGCGRIYAKVEAVASVPRARTQDKQPEGFWSDLGEAKRTLICVILALVVGFFAGREHLRYQFISSFRDVAEGISSAMSGGIASPPPSSEARQLPKEKLNKVVRAEPITGKMTKKGYFSGEYGQDDITFDILFENKTNRDIRGFNGKVIIADILGNVIMRVSVKITDPISANSSIVWGGSIDYNQFLDKHQALRDADIQDIVAEFFATKILFQDGEVLELE
jgi:hypothetical protein